MSAMKQKDAVIEAVILALPNFNKYQDNALSLLSAADLEAIKGSITNQILNGTVEYSKDNTNVAEVRSYARSMVMNHLKKAKELNGGQAYVGNTSNSGIADVNNTNTPRIKSVKLAPKGVNPDILPEELREYVKTLV